MIPAHLVQMGDSLWKSWIPCWPRGKRCGDPKTLQPPLQLLPKQCLPELLAVAPVSVEEARLAEILLTSQQRLGVRTS